MIEQTAAWDEAKLRERFYAATDYHVIPGGRKKLDYIFALIRRLQAGHPELKVLDVGCGNGSLDGVVYGDLA